ncbi:MAG: c-type cytochrome [Flavisolibacter sp.]
MKKSLLVTTGLVALVALSLAFTRPEEPKFKNLKVLPKDITKDQLDSVMHHFTASLNVHCNFCHVRNEAAKSWDFASDENKKKLVARDMMKMMDKINDKYFNVTGSKKNLNAKLMVTCFTCHHGSNEPATRAPRPQMPPRPQNDSFRTMKDSLRTMKDSVNHNK